ncbi:MAG: hypothetical protein K6E56_01965 [Lachnospiraceae bacterium]|nr:hypothetical protein [Lachnospiraceae bacterium]
MDKLNTLSKKIKEYILSGAKDSKTLGLELEHFVCDRDCNPAPYEVIEEVLNTFGAKEGRILYKEGAHTFGVFTDGYSVSLEPSCQIEISIDPREALSGIKKIYEDFRIEIDALLNEKGLHLEHGGVHPLVVSGISTPFDFPLIPKDRYHHMNEHFLKTGRHGAYMMRATASTQVSIDYKDEADALRKYRLACRLSPVLALIGEYLSSEADGEFKGKHILRTIIWNDTDDARCGYARGSVTAETLDDYAEHAMTTPMIMAWNNGEAVPFEGTAQDFEGETDSEDFVQYLLSMFFFNVRFKKYIEIRMADSLPVEAAVGYAALIKAIFYNDDVFEKAEKLVSSVKSIDEIKAAEEAIINDGFAAKIYEHESATAFVAELFEAAKQALPTGEKHYLDSLMPLQVAEFLYMKGIAPHDKEHIASAKAQREYLLGSTAKYHGRAVKTMYIPKIFTYMDIKRFENLALTMNGIFNKVIDRYKADPSYRKLFGFAPQLEELILTEKGYDCPIPISRIDIFYNEDSKEFTYCEFNTDGASAMNEDRELNISIRRTKAYKDFTADTSVHSIELFDSWVMIFLDIYADYAKKKGTPKTPNVAIIDYMEHATGNEFLEFQKAFENAGIKCEVLDIRKLEFKDDALYSPSGLRIDAIYRRAVTSDIEKEPEDIGDFLKAVREEKVCLIGAFQTQIAHNKILYEILHRPETKAFLSPFENHYVKCHVPFTAKLLSSLESENPEMWDSIMHEKNNWIIKPEDSYGSLGVHAGFECETDTEWQSFVKESLDKHYIVQRFCVPYRLKNIDLCKTGLDASDPENHAGEWITHSNLTGLFCYGGEFAGIYSRISYGHIISTQYSEMAVATLIVG